MNVWKKITKIMNYKKHYDNLIKTRKLLNRNRNDDNYYECHHILAKSMGGSDEPMNLILLTPKEHYIAHFLLWRIYRNREMAMAYRMMCNKSSRQYQIDKELYGKLGHSEDTKIKMSSSAKKKPIRTKETQEKINKALRYNYKNSNTAQRISNTMKGVKKTEEHKQNIAKSKIGNQNGRGCKGKPFSTSHLKNLRDARERRRLHELEEKKRKD